MKEVKMAEILSKPLALSKEIVERDLPVDEALKAFEESGLLNEYKGPFMSGVQASYIFNDTITVNCFDESKQPDGTYLITYMRKYIDDYKMSLYVQVLTSALKRKLKYHCFKNGTKIKIKGKLDMYISGPISFTDGNDVIPTRTANVGVAVTIIDFL